MRKITFSISLFVLLTLALTPFASAEWKRNTITNQTTERVFVVYSTWRGADSAKGIPRGYRTLGYYAINPSASRTFYAWANNSIYFRITKSGIPQKPRRDSTTFSQWIHPIRAFTAVSGTIGGTRPTYSTLNRNELVNSDGFLKYKNGSQITVNNTWVDIDEPPADPRLGGDGEDAPGGTGEAVNTPATGVQVTITPNPAGTNVEIDTEINLTVKVSRAGQGLQHKKVTLEVTRSLPEEFLNVSPEGFVDDIVAQTGTQNASLIEVPGFDDFHLDKGTSMKGSGTTDDKGEVKAALKVKPLATAGTFKLIAKVPEFNATRELSFTVGTGADELAGGLTISTSNTTVEPKAGSYNGRIPLTFRVTSKAGNALRGERIAVSERTTSGSVTSQLSSASLTTDGNGQATTNLNLQNSSTGKIRVTAHIEGSEPRVSRDLTITVRQTAHRLSVSGVPSYITSGDTRTITATVTSKNGTKMSGVTVKFTDSDDSEIAFSRTSGTTNSSGQVSTTLRTGSKGNADFRVEASGLSSQYFELTVEPDTARDTKHIDADGKRIGWLDDNYWYDKTFEFTFPGKVVSYSWRSSTWKAVVDKNDVYKSGDTVYVPVRILAKTFPTATIELWVTATYEVTAPSPGAPSLHSQFNPETQQLSTLWQDLSQVPEKTVLLPNYPNPFNPETWIPYRLAAPAEVTLSIYSLNGNRVRTLALGHRPPGFYESRSRAAYWDGRNDIGERVASGVYFYTLTAGDFAATGKMLILK